MEDNTAYPLARLVVHNSFLRKCEPVAPIAICTTSEDVRHSYATRLGTKVVAAMTSELAPRYIIQTVGVTLTVVAAKGGNKLGELDQICQVRH